MARLRQYKPEVATIDEMIQVRFEAGNKAGNLAVGLFGDYVEVTTYNGEKLDSSKIKDMSPEEQRQQETICQIS